MILSMEVQRLPGIAAENIGKSAYSIFKGGRDYFDNTVGVAGEHLTGAVIAAAFTQALEQESLFPWHICGGVSKI